MCFRLHLLLRLGLGASEAASLLKSPQTPSCLPMLYWLRNLPVGPPHLCSTCASSLVSDLGQEVKHSSVPGETYRLIISFYFLGGRVLCWCSSVATRWLHFPGVAAPSISPRFELSRQILAGIWCGLFGALFLLLSRLHTVRPRSPFRLHVALYRSTASHIYLTSVLTWKKPGKLRLHTWSTAGKLCPARHHGTFVHMLLPKLQHEVTLHAPCPMPAGEGRVCRSAVNRKQLPPARNVATRQGLARNSPFWAGCPRPKWQRAKLTDCNAAPAHAVQHEQIRWPCMFNVGQQRPTEANSATRARVLGIKAPSEVGTARFPRHRDMDNMHAARPR